MSGYDSVNRNVLSRVRKVLKRWRWCNHRWQAVPHLRASNRKCSAANSGAVNRRLNEAVAAGRAKPSATWKVSNVSERAKVRRCTAVEDLVYKFCSGAALVVAHFTNFCEWTQGPKHYNFRFFDKDMWELLEGYWYSATTSWGLLIDPVLNP